MGHTIHPGIAAALGAAALFGAAVPLAKLLLQAADPWLLAALLNEPLTARLVAAGALMAAGIWLHLTERHAHKHVHAALEHLHEHAHGTDDPHHDHAQAISVPPGTRHSH